MTLSEVLAIQTHSGQEWRMFAFIVRELKRQGVYFTKDEFGNLYAQKGSGDSFPCVVAHMDTVHALCEDLTVLQVGDKLTGFNRVTMQQTGIGGDDKVGVYIALRCLEMYDSIKVAFFVDEERGCVGSGLADVSFFSDCRFVLQADRRGNSDFIHTAGGVGLSSKKFRKAVNKYLNIYGYKFTTGLMTDVMALKENGVGVSMANVSCGYHRPHSKDEWVSVSQVDKCLDLFCAIIENMTDVYKHEYVKPAPRPYTAPSLMPSYGYGSYGSYGSSTSKYNSYWESLDAQQAGAWRSKGALTAQPAQKETTGICDGCLNVAYVSYSSYYNCDLCIHCKANWK